MLFFICIFLMLTILIITLLPYYYYGYNLYRALMMELLVKQEIFHNTNDEFIF